MRENAFEQNKNLETQVKIQPWVSANWYSNNWAQVGIGQ